MWLPPHPCLGIVSEPSSHFSVSSVLAWQLANGRVCVPRAVVLSRPPQHVPLPSASDVMRHALVPRAVVLPRPPQDLELPAESTARGIQPRQQLPLTEVTRAGARRRAQAASVDASGSGVPRRRDDEVTSEG